MRNVLMLTNIYPTSDPSYEGTPVCHFFTREWVKMGYNVRVIHFESRFPSIYYKVGGLFQQLIMAKTGCVVNLKTPTEVESYKVDDVPVLHVPVRKCIPHKRASEKEMIKAIAAVKKYLVENNFEPDVITAHFAQPQLEALYMLKQIYSNARTCMVLHSAGESVPTVYSNYLDLFSSVDTWGFRSVAFMRQFESLYGKKEREFLCYSGIPARYLTKSEKEFKGGVRHFSFVGSLYKLKRVEDTIIALNDYFGNQNYHFDIVGSGSEHDNLQKLICKLNVQDKVKLLGKKKRDDAQEIVAMSDCFIMVSSHEAFGLVYLEAMAKGCITIATRGQGIDGVIIDGENGFLCEAENPQSIVDVLKRIEAMSQSDLQAMSRKAQKTAALMTNENVAKSYIENIINNG